MSDKICKGKKCKKILPKGYKGKYCESCENKRAHKAKNGVKAGAGGVGLLAALFLFLRRK